MCNYEKRRSVSISILVAILNMQGATRAYTQHDRNRPRERERRGRGRGRRGRKGGAKPRSEGQVYWQPIQHRRLPRRRKRGGIEEREGGGATTPRAAPPQGGEREARGRRGRKAVPKLFTEFFTYNENTVLYIFPKGIGVTKRNSPNMMESVT